MTTPLFLLRCVELCGGNSRVDLSERLVKTRGIAANFNRDPFDPAATTSTALAKIEEAGGKLAAAGDTIAGAGKKMSVLSAAVVGVGAAAVHARSRWRSGRRQSKRL